MSLYSHGKEYYFHAIPSQFKERKKIELLHAFGSITMMSSRSSMSCCTHENKTCACVYVGSRDNTAWTGESCHANVA